MHDRIMIAGEHELLDRLVELDRPIIRAFLKYRAAQVMHDVAAADHEHAFVAQGMQLLPQRIVKFQGLGMIESELHDRNPGIREHPA